MSEITEDEVRAQAQAAAAVARAAAIMARLRGPSGCPWDREQSFDSIKKHTLEEVYEVFDAIERRDWPGLRDELGDLLLQVLFYAQMAADEDLFSLGDVAEGLNAKLIRRHPHIFADAHAPDAAAVVRTWDAVKRSEKESADGSRLDEVSRAMPAAIEATKLGSKAAKAGFDWTDATGLFRKLDEESRELEVEVEAADEAKIADELGDLLFTAMNLARHLRVDPESALRAANAKFRRRFAAMEADATAPLETLTPQQLEELWAEAKRAERAGTNR